MYGTEQLCRSTDGKIFDGKKQCDRSEQGENKPNYDSY